MKSFDELMDALNRPETLSRKEFKDVTFVILHYLENYECLTTSQVMELQCKSIKFIIWGLM